MDWATASEIAAAVKRGQSALVGRRGRAGAHRCARIDALNAFTAVVADRARTKARAIDAGAEAGKPLGPLAGVPFAVKNLFDVQGLTTRRGLQDQPRSAAGRARRNADRAAGSCGRRSGRRAQHGRIRLRLHRRECPRRTVAQSARPHPHDRRLVRRLRRRGRRRAGAAVARLRHQRFDPRAVVVLRTVRAEADLWPAVARAHVSVRRQPRSSRTVGAQRRRPGARLRRDAGRRCRRPGLRGATGRACRARCSIRASKGLRIAVAGGYFRKGMFPGGARGRRPRSRAALDVTREIEIPEARARALRRLRHHRDRRRGAASRPAAQPRRATSIRPCATG